MEQVKRINLGEINASLCIGASVEIEAVIEQNKGGTTVSKQYVSDLIGEDVISTWEPRQIIMIISGTDTGKSYFIRNRVYEHFKSQGKKVLYLVSRSILKQQFMFPMANETNIAFMTYQAVEEIQSNPNRNLGEWDIVVCDECHYFISDSAFNKRTDLSFDWIMAQQNTIRIFLTATGDGIDRYFNEQKIAFDRILLPISNRQIKSLTYFNGEMQMERIAEEVIAHGEKGIFFLSNLETAYSLYRKFKENSLFLCSKYRKPYAKYMDEESISKVIEAEHFDCNLLFATSAVDAGVSIKDRALKTIVVDMLDTNTLVQCIGRKRIIDDTDYFDLYVHNYSNNRIGGNLRSLKRDNGKVTLLNNEGQEAYNSAHGRGNDGSGIIFDKPIQVDGKTYFVKAVNKLRHTYTTQMIEIYQTILQKGVGYIRYVADLLDIKEYSVMEDAQHSKNLAEYLESMVGRPMLTKKDREHFVERVNVTIDGKRRKEYISISGCIEGSGLPYRLIRYRKKPYRIWEIVKIPQ